MVADRALLFSLLALQNDFVDKAVLLTAFSRWLADRSESLDRFLVKEGVLDEDDGYLLWRLVDRHVSSHDGKVEASLQSLSTLGSLKDDLFSLSGDTDFQTSVSHLRAPALATIMPPARDSSSSGRRFEFRRPLDRGGLGVVSVAMDRELNREVALKEIRPERADDQAQRSKFLLEAQVTGGLEHPGIVPIYSLGAGDDGRPYYAMRLIRGDNLLVHIRNFHKQVAANAEPLDGPALRKLLRRFLDVCDAINYAHSRGVLHRDLKPSNVMIGQYGETLVVDWGLAKPLGVRRSLPIQSDDTIVEELLVTDSSGDGLTIEGSIMGTAAYAPPEQLSGKLDRIDERSDVYGLGAILYEILTGRPPANSGTLEAVIKSVVSGDIREPREVLAGMPMPLNAICCRAISVNPASRYPTAFELGQEVERWLDGLSVDAYPEPFNVRLLRWVRSHQSLVATAAAIVLMSTLSLGLFSTMLSKNNAALAKLNERLDERNRELDTRNAELTAANLRESDARKQADTQSQLLFGTLTDVVVNIQKELENIPGVADIRRRLLGMSLEQLDQVASDYVSQAQVDETNMVALASLGNLCLRYGGAEHLDVDTATPSPSAKHAIEQAVSFYRRSWSIANSRYNEATDNVNRKRDLMLACNRMGNVMLRAGQVEESLKFYSQCVEWGREILAALPEDLAAKREFSVACRDFGYLNLRRDQFAEAKLHLDIARDLGEAILQADPDDLENVLEITLTYRLLGVYCRVNDMPEQALEFASRDLSFSKQLLKTSPGDVQLQHRLAGAHAALGLIHSLAKRHQDAIRHLQESVTMDEALLILDPGSLSVSSDIADACYHIGREMFVIGEDKSGIEYMQRSAQIYQSIVEKDPGDHEGYIQLASVYGSLAIQFETLGQIQDAIEFGNRCVQASLVIVKIDPMSIREQRRLAGAYLHLSQANRKANQLNEAMEYCKLSIAIRGQVSAMMADPLASPPYEAVGYLRAGELAFELGLHDEAISYFQQHLDCHMRVLEIDPENATSKQGAWIGLYRLGCVQAQCQEVELAKTNLGKASALVIESINLKGETPIYRNWRKKIGDELKRLDTPVTESTE